MGWILDGFQACFLHDNDEFIAMDVDVDAACDGDLSEEDEIEFTLEVEREMCELLKQKAIKEKTQKQLKERKKSFVACGFHHGHLNPLPASWKYPKGLRLFQMITVFLMGSPSEGVPALKFVKRAHVLHFDKGGLSLSKMKRVMKVVQHFGELRGFWPTKAHKFWNGKTITELWDGIWDDIKPYCLTKMKGGVGISDLYHKSCVAELSWTTCHDKFVKTGLYKQPGICRQSYK